MLDPRGAVLAARIVHGCLEMFLVNSLEALDSGRLFIEQYLQPWSFDALLMNRVEVVFEEVASNVIRHGFLPGSDQLLFVVVAAEAGAVTFLFEDDGLPFDPLSVPLPEGPRSLESAPIGGSGLPLIRKLSSNISYERVESYQLTDRLRGRTFKPANALTVRISK